MDTNIHVYSKDERLSLAVVDEDAATVNDEQGHNDACRPLIGPRAAPVADLDGGIYLQITAEPP